jgi:serine/threonine protein kinase
MSLVGRQIGRYRIVEQLGQGGMSVVYKGIDTALDREVAVKVLHPHLAQRVESRKRLEREAKAVARLRHPNILEVYDYANENVAEAFIVTELIAGKTLREFLNDEPLQPPEIAAMVVHELAAALAHAHDAGVLHRDLKPENVMVRNDGVLKLMDFGIAKILDRDEKMTLTGALVGSPAHMAPEIIEGEEAGAEADVFSLGTMLYLFATGRLPFVAPNTTATLKRILDCVYDDPRQLAPTVSDQLAEIIAQCLQRSPSARFSSATKLRDALAELLNGLGLTRPHEELLRFFLEPRAYRKELVPRIIEALLTQAQTLLGEKRPARALAALNQVLAHDSNNARATALLGQMQARRQREQRTKRLRRASVTGLAGVALLVGGAQAFFVATQPADFKLPTTFAPWNMRLGNVAWAKRVAEVPPLPLEVLDAGAREPAGPIAVKQSRGAGARTELVDFGVKVRPFGYLRVDDGPLSQAQPLHQLRLSPGKHRFTVTCDVCEAPKPVEAVVVAGEVLALVAPLKPSLVMFGGFPADARVRVGGEERTVAETLQRPFQLVTPAAGSRRMQHELVYSVVSQAGEVLEAGTWWLEPGKTTLVERGRKP